MRKGGDQVGGRGGEGRGCDGAETAALVERAEVVLAGEHHVGDAPAAGLIERSADQR